MGRGNNCNISWGDLIDLFGEEIPCEALVTLGMAAGQDERDIKLRLKELRDRPGIWAMLGMDKLSGFTMTPFPEVDRNEFAEPLSLDEFLNIISAHAVAQEMTSDLKMKMSPKNPS